MRCGRLISPGETPMRRIPSVEAEYLRHAAKGVCDPEPLIEHAQARAMRQSSEYVRDPLTIRAGVDWLAEARSELADSPNYLVWWLQHRDPDEEEEALRVWEALRLVVAAYDLLRPR